MRKIIALRNALRLIGLSGALIFALSAGAGLAKASISIGGGNGTTGPNSENQNEWVINHSADVTIENFSHTLRSELFEVNAGNTTVADNTEVEDVSTGDVVGNITVSNLPNGGDIQLMNMDLGNVHVDMENNLTGPNSLNENDVTVDANHNVDINNESNLTSDVHINANSGNNEVNCNTVVGDVSTGDVNFTANQTNRINNGMGDLDLSGMGSVSVTGDLVNHLTGPQSTNKNNLHINANADVNIRNNATITNTERYDANTGNNSIGHNTVVGDVSTGDVRITSTTTNTAN